MTRPLPWVMVASCLFSASPALADVLRSPRLPLGGVDLVLAPGPSRAIPHSMSASRDTAVIGVEFFPYTSTSLGIDFAAIALLGRDWEERIGIFGMTELHSACPWGCSGSAPFLWRGVAGGSLSLSAVRWGRALFGDGGKLEFTLSMRHESEHSSTGGDYPPGLAEGYIMGDFVMPDVAARIPVGRLDIELRAQLKVFVPTPVAAESSDANYRLGPGFDAIFRWRLHPLVHPFSSTFFEYISGDETAARVIDAPGTYAAVKVPDLFLFRTQLGGIVVLRPADLQVFTFLEVGHGEGVLKFREEVRWGFGTRGVLIR
jgi:hypothetical protein